MQTGQSLKIRSGSDFLPLTWKKHTLKPTRKERTADRQTEGLLKADN